MWPNPCPLRPVIHTPTARPGQIVPVGALASRGRFFASEPPPPCVAVPAYVRHRRTAAYFAAAVERRPAEALPWLGLAGALLRLAESHEGFARLQIVGAACANAGVLRVRIADAAEQRFAEQVAAHAGGAYALRRTPRAELATVRRLAAAVGEWDGRLGLEGLDEEGRRVADVWLSDCER